MRSNVMIIAAYVLGGAIAFVVAGHVIVALF